jgi:hypothetical protein
LDLTSEYAQAKESRLGAWEQMATCGGDIAAEYEQGVLGPVSENKVEG